MLVVPLNHAIGKLECFRLSMSGVPVFGLASTCEWIDPRTVDRISVLVDTIRNLLFRYA